MCSKNQPKKGENKMLANFDVNVQNLFDIPCVFDLFTGILMMVYFETTPHRVTVTHHQDDFIFSRKSL